MVPSVTTGRGERRTNHRARNRAWRVRA